MKKLTMKWIAALLVLGMVCMMLAGCGSNETMVSMTVDGKTYTLTTAEYDILMKIRKLDIACSMLMKREYDTPAQWAQEYTGDDAAFDGQTVDQYYTAMILDQARAIVVEKYLAELNGLSISKDKLDTLKTEEKTAIQNLGGKGTYKQYWGYTASDYYAFYAIASERSSMVSEFLYNEETGARKLSEEDLAKYYNENYVAYQLIVIDTTNDVDRDEEGNRVVNDAKDGYKTTKIEDEDRKTEKQNLADLVLAELKDGASFDEMIDKYSDEYFSVEYKRGLPVLKDSTFITDAVQEAIKDLEIGEYTTEAIGVNSNAYFYLVKCVELPENAFSDEEYEDFFTNYRKTLETEDYEEYVESFFDKVTVDTALASEFTMADTYLSKYADYYYSMYLNSLYGGN